MPNNQGKKRGRKSKQDLLEAVMEKTPEQESKSEPVQEPTVGCVEESDDQEEVHDKSCSNCSSEGGDLSIDLPNDLESTTEGTNETNSENEYSPSLQAEELANILSAFFHNDDGENVTDVLSSIRDSIDKNSKCVIKLSQVLEKFMKE